MKKTALLLVILIVCASLVASAPWQPVGRDEKKVRILELLVLKELLQPYQKRTSINDRVKTIMSGQFGINEWEIQDSDYFIDDLGADSLDTVELVMALEEEFGLEIPDDEAENLITVKDAIDYIKAHSQ